MLSRLLDSLVGLALCCVVLLSIYSGHVKDLTYDKHHLSYLRYHEIKTERSELDRSEQINREPHADETPSRDEIDHPYLIDSHDLILMSSNRTNPRTRYVLSNR